MFNKLKNNKVNAQTVLWILLVMLVKVADYKLNQMKKLRIAIMTFIRNIIHFNIILALEYKIFLDFLIKISFLKIFFSFNFNLKDIKNNLMISNNFQYRNH